ncbi:GntR family transcriptional regulator [Caldibacillus thermolactis]|jgi:DNA-binding GntR family transcriptional regulator|uniref:GntR family transcriptional regulator n=1 Tax=Pallidibacillus thermolactis TaxID=251051 RepID=A0ABT2WCK0_9BACI|nr:GntR family transcriptional regulator [Pallidibacillus thermolactis]MCU9593408.1 GntR family transcriptional regulator [Pallidibacillus thermolactis]MCU9602065.1 GntR family transcriptional regulator [Pallidibacillus thermolactis subsp. kokeshiiformis]MED1673725.1 GntR family transcriptional regulator [Pallidibacillus thermolactis subsp. kokeshiiformis]
MKQSKKQKAYEYMKMKIVEGHYAPGQRIVINQLVKELSTSAIPIREAVRQLEAEGLIEYKQNIGPVVSPINENEYEETLSVLALMEGYATALSQKSFPEEKITDLITLNEAMKEALEEFNFGEFGKLNREFHYLTYSTCPNKYLIDTIKKTWERLDSIRVTGSTINPKRAKESVAEHEKIIHLLKTKASFEEVELAVRSHKLNTLNAFKKNKTKITGTTFI